MSAGLPSSMYGSPTQLGAAGSAGLPPVDQADGLRRLFAPRVQTLWPLVANPYDSSCGGAVQRIVNALGSVQGQVLVIDVAEGAPPAPEAVKLDLAAGIESLSPGLSYFSGAGMPALWAQRHGHAAGLIDELAQAAPQADVLLLHADAQDLPRLCRGRSVCPTLLLADHPSSVRHAYAAMKALAQRCAWTWFDVLLAAPAASRRSTSIVQTLRDCAQRFGIGAELRLSHAWDPDSAPVAPEAGLLRLVQAQFETLHPAPQARPRAAAGLHA